MVGIMADGMSSTSIAYSRATVTFSPDNIAEFKVISSSFSAKYGVTGGGIISTVSKSGGQELHGSAFLFTRNPALPARPFYQPTPSRLRPNGLGQPLGAPRPIRPLSTGSSRP